MMGNKIWGHKEWLGLLFLHKNNKRNDPIKAKTQVEFGWTPRVNDKNVGVGLG